MSKKFKKKIAQVRKKNAAIKPKKKIAKISAKISSREKVPHSFWHIRTFAIWSIIFVAFFATLSLVVSYLDSFEKSPLQERLAQVATLSLRDDEDTITLLATGDVMLGRYVELKMRKLNDYTHPFQYVADSLKSADITFGNLETPLLAGLNVPKGSMTFRADLEGVNGLLYAGYDVISLANNHTMNYQIPGLTSTIQALKKANILFAGAGKTLDGAHTPAIFEVKNAKVAFYAYNDPNIPPRRHGEAAIKSPGIAKMDIEAVKNDVKNALDSYGADIVVVSMHAGKEYTMQPTQFQKDFAHAAIDAGASVVIGHHPHWVQPVEYYGDGVIFYSLGNFVFDQFFSEEVRTGLIAKINLFPGEKPEVELFPVKLENTQPKILEGEEREQVLAKYGL